MGKTGIYEKSLLKARGEVSLSAFALLFSEMVQYYQNSKSNNFWQNDKNVQSTYSYLCYFVYHLINGVAGVSTISDLERKFVIKFFLFKLY